MTFVNDLPETPEFNIIDYLNYYNGGGVAAGDVDGDGSNAAVVVLLQPLRLH